MKTTIYIHRLNSETTLVVKKKKKEKKKPETTLARGGHAGDGTSKINVLTSNHTNHRRWVA
jgi:hypothetical protein